jgi:cytoskeletal protein RodZ
MVGFTKKNVRTLTLGEKLRSFRSERRISLNDVSRNTKIQLKYLEYLEEGNYKKLPVDVYVKGFLRSYAEFLGVDEKIFIRLYEKEKGIKINLEKANGDNFEKRESINMAPFLITPKIITAAVGLLITAGLFFYLYRELGNFANTPKLIILSPTQNEVKDSNSVVVNGVSDKDADIFINDQPVLVSDEGKFNESLALQSGTNYISIKAINRFGKEANQNIIVQSNYQEKQQNTTNEEINDSMANMKQEGINIEVSAISGPVWISVEADGNLVFSGTILMGAVQSFMAVEKISISSNKANATLIKFNGKDVGVLSEKPEGIKNVLFTKDMTF